MFTFQTLKKRIKHYPMTDRLIVIREYEQYKDRIKMNNTIIT